MLLAITAAIVLVSVTLASRSGAVRGRKSSQTSYRIIKETVTNIIEVSGTIQAAMTQSLTAAENGTVTAVHVAVGDKVRKGDVLMELDKSEQEYNLAKLDYDIAQKRLNGSPKELSPW